MQVWPQKNCINFSYYTVDCETALKINTLQKIILLGRLKFPIIAFLVFSIGALLAVVSGATFVLDRFLLGSAITLFFISHKLQSKWLMHRNIVLWVNSLGCAIFVVFFQLALFTEVTTRSRTSTTLVDKHGILCTVLTPMPSISFASHNIFYFLVWFLYVYSPQTIPDSPLVLFKFSSVGLFKRRK